MPRCYPEMSALFTKKPCEGHSKDDSHIKKSQSALYTVVLLYILENDLLKPKYLYCLVQLFDR